MSFSEPHHHDHEVPLEGKNPIECITSSPSPITTTTPPALIFTHGAGGTLHSDGILNFRVGFARNSHITCFQGSMNLPSRVKMFNAVIDHQSSTQRVTALGGRSMGSRAAAMAAKDRKEIKYLILISYPLHTDKEDVRDEILIDIEENAKVLFLIGDRDAMCNLERLESVRKKMSARSWLVRVQGADHGMGVKPKVGTRGVGELTGRVVAEWLKSLDGDGLDEGKMDGRIWWDGEEDLEKWSGWGKSSPAATTTRRDEIVEKVVKIRTKKPVKKTGKSEKDLNPKGDTNIEKPVKKPGKFEQDSKPKDDINPGSGSTARRTRSSKNSFAKEDLLEDETLSKSKDQRGKRARDKSAVDEEPTTSGRKRRKA